MRPVPARIPRRNAQRGVVLAVVLILLLVMTLLAVASLSGTVLEERMGTAQVDRNLSLQAAEATLREAEARVRALIDSEIPAVGDDCDAGVCPMPQPGVADEQQRWLNAGFWADDSGNWAQFTGDLDGVTAQPRYIIELVDDAVADRQTCTTGGDVSLEANCTLTSKRFRITVRSAQEGRAVVMLQSIYAKP